MSEDAANSPILPQSPATFFEPHRRSVCRTPMRVTPAPHPAAQRHNSPAEYREPRPPPPVAPPFQALVSPEWSSPHHYPIPSSQSRLAAKLAATTPALQGTCCKAAYRNRSSIHHLDAHL